MSGEVTKEKLRVRASHIIKEGRREEYEMVHGSAFGNRVTIERKLGNILNVQELPQPEETETNWDHAYAEDSRYNYNG
jgi:6-pyruvoyl-tetrahydropterin synthase